MDDLPGPNGKTCPRWVVITPNYVISGDSDPAEPVTLMCNLLPDHIGIAHFDQESEMWWRRAAEG
jgi:hypothetical protein